MDADPTIILERWRGSWANDDPDVNFKSEVAEYNRLDPLVTVEGLSRHAGMRSGASRLRWLG